MAPILEGVAGNPSASIPPLKADRATLGGVFGAAKPTLGIPRSKMTACEPEFENRGAAEQLGST